MAKRPTHVVEKLEQLELLRSAVRMQLIQTMQQLAPCTVAELAEHLGRSPETLYYHIHMLVDGGLVEETGRRPGRRKPEAVYDLVARVIRVDPEARTPAYLGLLGEVYSTVIRQADRDLNRALEHEVERPPKTARRTGMVRACGRLSPKNYRMLRKMMLEIEAFVLANDEPGHDEFSVTTVLSPRSAKGGANVS